MSKKPAPAQHIADRITTTAYDLFAQDGFEVSLAAIAKKARVTPAQLAAHFRGKPALIQSVIVQLFAGRWRPEWDVLLADRRIPLDQRLIRFYVEYRSGMRAADSRLWTRAGLLGVHKSGKFSSQLAQRMLIPIIRELRHEAGLPAPETRPVLPLELELAGVLHGAIAFINTRSHVFGMSVHGTLEEIVGINVRVFLAGAPGELRRLHAA
ncbi:MAG: TetR/AcrR family transcriptional regulator [Burkholderiales bacterium]